MHHQSDFDTAPLVQAPVQPVLQQSVKGLGFRVVVMVTGSALKGWRDYYLTTAVAVDACVWP